MNSFKTDLNKENEAKALKALTNKTSTFTDELPSIFHLDVTGKCNLSCLYCQRDFFTKTNSPFLKGNMSNEIFEALAPNFKYAKVVALLSMLGEPLVVKELPTWWEKILEYGAKPQTTTNGTFLTPELAQMFVEKGGRLKISIDTIKQEELNIMRPKMTVDLLMNRLELITKMRAKTGSDRLQLGVNVCVTSLNVESVVETLEACSNRAEIFIFNFSNFRLPRDQSGTYHEEARQLSLDLDSPKTKEAWFKILDWSKTQKTKHDTKFVFPYSKKEWNRILGDNVPDGLGETSFEDTELKQIGYYCCVPWMKAHVLSNGDVIPCSLLYWPQPELVMGNVLKEDFKSIWHGEKFKNFREKMTSDKYPFCQECKSWWRFYTPERVD